MTTQKEWLVQATVKDLFIILFDEDFDTEAEAIAAAKAVKEEKPHATVVRYHLVEEL